MQHGSKLNITDAWFFVQKPLLCQLRRHSVTENVTLRMKSVTKVWDQKKKAFSSSNVKNICHLSNFSIFCIFNMFQIIQSYLCYPKWQSSSRLNPINACATLAQSHFAIKQINGSVSYHCGGNLGHTSFLEGLQTWTACLRSYHHTTSDVCFL